MAAIESRLVFLQVVRYGELQVLAAHQQSQKTTAAGKRGDILDRRGRVLATSVDADSIYAVPSATASQPSARR
jgi:cell division protein FtsI (penicillin-binding protein 3)